MNIHKKERKIFWFILYSVARILKWVRSSSQKWRHHLYHLLICSTTFSAVRRRHPLYPLPSSPSSASPLPPPPLPPPPRPLSLPFAPPSSPSTPPLALSSSATHSLPPLSHFLKHLLPNPSNHIPFPKNNC